MQRSSTGIRSTLTVDGRDRTLTALGSEESSRARPLVLVFHGSRQTARSHRRFTGDALAPLTLRDETVVAYLDGYRGNWNDARRESSFPARREGIDDIAFVRAAIDHLAASHGIDRTRVLLVGYSNGGQMVMRLLHEAPDMMAGAVVVAATMPAPESFVLPADAPGPRPVPVVLVHGTRDRIVPFEGGTMSRWAQMLFRVGGRTLSARDTARHFAERNGILAPASSVRLPSRDGSRTTVVRTDHRDGDRPPVTLYTIEGGGHTIPGPTPAPWIVGRTNTDIALADLIADALRSIPETAGR